MNSEYYCKECQRNHKHSSKIGKEHLKYKKIIIKRIKPQHNINKIERNQTKVQKQNVFNEILKPSSDDKEENKLKNLVEVERESRSNPVANLVRGYKKSYRKGYEKYGVWWKVFQLSIWSIVLTLLLTASIIFIVFLPKIDFINLTLR